MSLDLDLDALVDSVAVQAQIETGMSIALVAKHARSDAGRRVALMTRPKRAGRSYEWQSEEDAFLRRNLGVLSEEDIARYLRRSLTAVRLRWKRDLRLKAPSKRPDVMTAEQIAEGLGVDGKSVHLLIDRGILPGRRLPFDNVCRVVDRITLLCWLVNPRNWIYFDTGRIGLRGPRRTRHKYDAAFWQKAHRLAQLRRERWDDAWWTPGQVARYHGLSDNAAAVNNAIHEGRLPAVKWGNWHILRSDAVRITFCIGKGKGRKRGVQFSDAGDAFAILARAVGLSWSAIGALMNLPDDCDQVANRLRRLHRERATAAIIRRHGLALRYDRRSGAVFADWKVYRHRFPGVARAMCHLRAGLPLSYLDRLYVCGVMRTWSERFYRGPKRLQLLQSLRFPHTRGEKSIREMLKRLQAAGVDPLARPLGFKKAA